MNPDFGVVVYDEDSNCSFACIVPTSLLKTWRKEKIHLNTMYNIYDPDLGANRTAVFKFIGGAVECETFLKEFKDSNETDSQPNETDSQPFSLASNSDLDSSDDDDVDEYLLLKQVNQQNRHRNRHPITPVVGRKSIPLVLSTSTPRSIPTFASLSQSTTTPSSTVKSATSSTVQSATPSTVESATPSTVESATPTPSSTVESTVTNEPNLHESIPAMAEMQDEAPTAPQNPHIDDHFVYYTHDRDDLGEAYAVPREVYRRMSSETRYLARGKILMRHFYGDQYSTFNKYAPGLLPKSGENNAKEMTPEKFYVLVADQKQLVPHGRDADNISRERGLTVVRSVRSVNSQTMARRLQREQNRARRAGGLARRIEFYDPTDEFNNN